MTPKESSRILGKYSMDDVTSIQITRSVNISLWFVTSGAVWNQLSNRYCSANKLFW